MYLCRASLVSQHLLQNSTEYPPPTEDMHMSAHFYGRMNHTMVSSLSLISPYIMRLSCEPKIHCSLLTYLEFHKKHTHHHTYLYTHADTQ